MFREIMSV